MKGRAQVPAVDLATLPKMKLSDLHELWHAHVGRKEPPQRRIIVRELAYRVQAQRDCRHASDAAEGNAIRYGNECAGAIRRASGRQHPAPVSSYAGPHAARAIAPGIPNCPGVAGTHLRSHRG